MVPKGEALSLAMKHKGLFLPEQKNVQVSIDWKTLANPENPPDPLEDAIRSVKLIDVESRKVSTTGEE